MELSVLFNLVPKGANHNLCELTLGMPFLKAWHRKIILMMKKGSQQREVKIKQVTKIDHLTAHLKLKLKKNSEK